MKPILSAILVMLALSGPASAYAGPWHVVENLSTQTCYRVHATAPREGWRDFGMFSTFRRAGTWIWRHRAICRASPVFR